MENYLEKDIMVAGSNSDNKGRLSIPGLFYMMMDMAGEHGSGIGIGNRDLARRGLGWLVTKTKMRIYSLPKMLEIVRAKTWPSAPGLVRCNRYYTFCVGDELIAEGKNEWTILDFTTGKPQKMAEVYPGDFEHLADISCDEPFLRSKTNFAECPEISTYIVNSSDIDVSQHMNNVAYIRAGLGSLTCEELQELNPNLVEIAYRVQCYEKEKLSIRRNNIENGCELGVVKEDGSTAAVITILRD